MKIVINGTEHEWSQNYIKHADIIELSGCAPSAYIKYHGGEFRPDMFVRVQPGMTFRVADTGAA